MTTEVFLAAGVWASAGEGGRWIDLKEIKPAGKSGHVGLKVDGTYPTASLKPCEAKKLADQLYDLAKRVEERDK